MNCATVRATVRATYLVLVATTNPGVPHEEEPRGVHEAHYVLVCQLHGAPGTEHVVDPGQCVILVASFAFEESQQLNVKPLLIFTRQVDKVCDVWSAAVHCMPVDRLFLLLLLHESAPVTLQHRWWHRVAPKL